MPHLQCPDFGHELAPDLAFLSEVHGREFSLGWVRDGGGRRTTT